MSKFVVTSLIAGLLLSGCAVREANLRILDNQRVLTSTEKTALVAHVRETFFDPYSIRDIEVSTAAPSMGIDGSTTFNVCLKLNGKNRLGGYVGRSATIYYFNPAGAIVHSSDIDYGFCSNPKLRYSQFPELEKLTTK